LITSSDLKPPTAIIGIELLLISRGKFKVVLLAGSVDFVLTELYTMLRCTAHFIASIFPYPEDVQSCICYIESAFEIVGAEFS
jgi:hypothetical protein